MRCAAQVRHLTKWEEDGKKEVGVRDRLARAAVEWTKAGEK